MIVQPLVCTGCQELGPTTQIAMPNKSPTDWRSKRHVAQAQYALGVHSAHMPRSGLAAAVDELNRSIALARQIAR